MALHPDLAKRDLAVARGTEKNREPKASSVGRRDFFKDAAAGAAVMAATGEAETAEAAAAPRPRVLKPTQAQAEVGQTGSADLPPDGLRPRAG